MKNIPCRLLARASLIAAAFLAAAACAFGAVTSADLQIVKTRTTPVPAHPGEVIGYDMTVTNNGPDTASNPVITDAVPSGTTFDEGGTFSAGWNCTLPSPGATGTMTCTAASIGSGATADFYIEVAVDTGAKEVDNTASAPPERVGTVGALSLAGLLLIRR